MASQSVRPEGGWGWMVVLGCFLNQLLVEGHIRSFGFLYIALQERFDSSAVMTSWIAACLGGIAMVLAPVACMLVERFGCRPVVMVGSILACISLVITSFMPQLYLFYISYSLITGIGGSMIYTPMYLIVSQYFDKKRGLALGLASLGSAVGTYIIPVLVDYTIDTLGYQGNLLIQGALMLNNCVSGALYRPLPEIVIQNKPEITENNQSMSVPGLREYKSHPVGLHASDGVLYKKMSNIGLEESYSSCRQFHKTHFKRSMSNVIESFGNVAFLNSQMVPRYSHLKDNVDRTTEYVFNAPSTNSDIHAESSPSVAVTDEGVKNSCEAIGKSSRSNLNQRCSIFKNLSYLLFCFQIFTVPPTVAPTFFFLPSLAREVGLTDSEITILLAIIGVCGFIGTFTIGLIFDLKIFRRHKGILYSIIAIIQGIGMICLGLSHNFITMVIICICVGFVVTSLIGQRASATSHYVTPEQLPFAFGVITMSQGLGLLFGPIIQGLLRDQYGTYSSCYFYAGAGLILSSLLVVMDYTIRFISSCRHE